MISYKRRGVAFADTPLWASNSVPAPNAIASGWITDPDQATFTANFDTFRNQIAGVESGYGNLLWRNLTYYTMDSLGSAYANSGYAHHITSGDHAAYGGANGTWVEMESGGANFELTSLSIGAAWRNGMTISIGGFDDGVVVNSTQITVGVAAPSLVTLGWNVDRVVFLSFGGTSANLGSEGQQFILDDIVYGGDTGSISGTLWHDRDGDGATGARDRVISGRTVFIDADRDGVLDADEVRTSSDANGRYSFDGLAFGTYVVRELLPKRWAGATLTKVVDDYVTTVSSGGFVDISASGTMLTLNNTDEGVATVTFGSPISLFGHTLSSMYVSTNGFLSTEAPKQNSWQNKTISAADHGGIIAPFWDDLMVGAGGGIFYLNDTANDRSIIQWSGMTAYAGGAKSTFQAIIENDGTVIFNYAQAEDLGASATIGLGYGTVYDVEHSYLGRSVDAGKTVTFEPEAALVPRTSEVTVDAGVDVIGVDFLSHAPALTTGTLTGVAFDDNNGDGVFNAGDTAKSGWTVFLDGNGNGRHDVGEAQTKTNGQGVYTFAALAPGQHDVVITAPLSWERMSFDAPELAASSAVTATAAKAVTPLERLAAAVSQANANTAASGHVYAAADFAKAHAGGELIVKVNPAAVNAAGGDSVDMLMTNLGATRIDATQGLGLELWQVKGDLQAAADALMKSGLVTYAQPNYTISLDQAGLAPMGGTNDRDNGLTYGLDQINAPEAWKYSTGSRDVVVGVIDTGVDLDHPDLIDNLWINVGEIAGDGIDNDGNGYVDDVHGYDFAYKDGNPDDVYGHGTHVAGTIGAVGNNGLGVSGVNQNVSIMALRYFNDAGSATSFDAVLAVEYATMMGADVTNNSWGGGGFDNALFDAIEAGPLFVASAGNSAKDNDLSNYYPQGYPSDKVISVAAVGREGFLSGFSQWGARTVDLAAPGVQTWSTVPLEQGGYAFYDGTSMAAPHVTGAVALLLSIFPDLTAAEIKAALLAGVDLKGDLADKTVSGGILDIMGAIQAVTHKTATATVAAGGTTTLDFAAFGGASDQADTLTGFGFAERINGLGGDDTINGGAGDDTITGGIGNDTLTGGTGADRFVFAGSAGKDVITDFSAAEGDRIQINGRGASFASLTFGTSEDGDAVITHHRTTIELDGILAADVTEDMFLFPASVSPEAERLIALADVQHMDGIAILAHHFMIP